MLKTPTEIQAASQSLLEYLKHLASQGVMTTGLIEVNGSELRQAVRNAEAVNEAVQALTATPAPAPLAPVK